VGIRSSGLVPRSQQAFLRRRWKWPLIAPLVASKAITELVLEIVAWTLIAEPGATVAGTPEGRLVSGS
jgi:hypothetical protein